MTFSLNNFTTSVFLSHEIPDIEKINKDPKNVLLIADENTSKIADKIRKNCQLPLCIIKSGEENKNWQSVNTILENAVNANLDRDSLFLGVGGGVICDLCGFAASIYMRGCRLALVPTTLLAMIDSSIGGKTGINNFGIKNLTGSFYPAQAVYMPFNVLLSLAPLEIKRGMAEMIKAAVLSADDFFDLLTELKDSVTDKKKQIDFSKLPKIDLFYKCIEKAANFKGSIVCEDLYDTGRRMLLNLGHTFGHALESVTGPGKITHGEAVAWGILRSCSLGCALGITPKPRAQKIRDLIQSFGFCSTYPSIDSEALFSAMKRDKKKKLEKLTFIVPDEISAKAVRLETESEFELLKNILQNQD